MSSSSYLTDLQCRDERSRSAPDAVWAILDAIEAAGPAGADVESLALRTHYDGSLLSQVLRDLQDKGMTTSSSDRRYRVTTLGETARCLASH